MDRQLARREFLRFRAGGPLLVAPTIASLLGARAELRRPAR